MGRKEIVRDVRGKRENAPIYIYIYIGPRSGDNEATPSIQRMTRGDSIGKCNRRNSVSEMTHATQKLTRGISFGRRDEHRRSTNDFATRGS